jgi:hypothetical protein
MNPSSAASTRDASSTFEDEAVDPSVQPLQTESPDSRFGGPRVRVEGRDPGRRGQDCYEPFALYSSFFVDRMPGRATTCSTGVHLLYDS